MSPDAPPFGLEGRGRRAAARAWERRGDWGLRLLRDAGLGLPTGRGTDVSRSPEGNHHGGGG